MSTLKIEERVAVKAPPAKVWAFLLSPEDIITCLPGAGLDSVEDERNFHGNVKVKVGPVTVAYKGEATLTEVDDDGHRVTMVGEGKEKGGAGKVKMTMTSHIEAVDGGSEVVIDADVELAGKVVRFGRGMIQGVSKEVFKQFGDKLRSKLEVEEAEPEVAPEAEPAPEPASAPEAPAASAPPADAHVAVPVPEGSPAPTAEHELDDTAPTQPPAKAPAPAPAKALAPAQSVPVPAKAEEEQEAVNALGLVFKVLWNTIANFFRRLFGRPERS